MTFLQVASPKFEQYTNPLIRIKWGGEPSGYAENLDKIDFLGENKVNCQFEIGVLLFTACTRF